MDEQHSLRTANHTPSKNTKNLRLFLEKRDDVKHSAHRSFNSNQPSSPSVNDGSTEKISTFESFRKRFSNTKEVVRNAFINSIPSEHIKGLPQKQLYPAGVFLLVILLAVFLTLLIHGYYQELQVQYLSPLESETISTNCESVPISNSGRFIGSSKGIWEGAGEGFRYSDGIYVASGINYEVSKEEYEDEMKGLYNELVRIGDLAVDQDLALNLVYWMSYVLAGTTAHRVTLSGTPLVIFNREQVTGTLSNILYDCNETISSDFDVGTGKMKLVYSYQSYMSNPTCSNIVNPINFGYTPYANSDDFKIVFDVRTLITAIAINLGVIQPSDLDEISTLTNQETFGTSIAYNVSSYIDPRYPGMEPVLCISLAVNVTNCVFALGFVYALPVFNHVGANTSFPTPCNCSELSTEALDNQKDPCNLFSFLAGFLFWPTISDDAFIEFVRNSTVEEIHRLSYYPMFMASPFAKYSPLKYLLDYYRESAYEFCNHPEFGPCSFVTFSLFDFALPNWRVSEYYHQLFQGACKNTMSLDKSTWQKLVDTPFSPLTQGYQICNTDSVTALVNQAGVAMGNLSLLTPLAVMVVLVLLHCLRQLKGMFFLHHRHDTMYYLYQQHEKTRALDALAVALLMERDGIFHRNISRSYSTEMIDTINNNNNNNNNSDQNNNMYHDDTTKSETKTSSSTTAMGLFFSAKKSVFDYMHNLSETDKDNVHDVEFDSYYSDVNDVDVDDDDKLVPMTSNPALMNKVIVNNKRQEEEEEEEEDNDNNEQEEAEELEEVSTDIEQNMPYYVSNISSFATTDDNYNKSPNNRDFKATIANADRPSPSAYNVISSTTTTSSASAATAAAAADTQSSFCNNNVIRYLVDELRRNAEKYAEEEDQIMEQKKLVRKQLTRTLQTTMQLHSYYN